MAAYYNEFDPQAAAWLRELIKAGAIAPGEVDERSIVDVQPGDLAGFTQCHFFAGIGGWSHALRLAGWSDERPVWTGSCPCQPFSAAGKRKGKADERHLWPEFYRLIAERAPDVVFGEQVEAAVKLHWLDAVQTDMEAIGYAFGATVLPAAGVGAPHGRHRIYFVADSDSARRRPRWSDEAGDGRDTSRVKPSGFCDVGELADSMPTGRPEGRPLAGGRQVASGGSLGELDQSSVARLEGLPGHGDNRSRPGRNGTQPSGSVATSGPVSGFWHPAGWLPCRDGKARPVEPGTFPLAHGLPARVGRLRGYGNAIVPQAAAEFISAYLDYLDARLLA